MYICHVYMAWVGAAEHGAIGRGHRTGGDARCRRDILRSLQPHRTELTILKAFVPRWRIVVWS